MFSSSQVGSYLFEDYVKVVWIMLQQKKNDYFIAKNKSY
jgi:GDP-D-mannose dehydratase